MSFFLTLVMKYLTIIPILLSTWIPAQANSHLEKAYANLSVAVNDARKEAANRQNAYNAAVKKANDLKQMADTAKAAADKQVAAATKQAESMKAAITKAMTTPIDAASVGVATPA